MSSAVAHSLHDEDDSSDSDTGGSSRVSPFDDALVVSFDAQGNDGVFEAYDASRLPPTLTVAGTNGFGAQLHAKLSA